MATRKKRASGKGARPAGKKQPADERARIAYPFKKVGAAKALAPPDLEKLRAPEAKSGGGPAPTAEVAAHMAREKALASSARPKVDARTVKLLHGYAERGTSPAEVIDRMVAVTQRGKSRAAFERAQAVFNEVSAMKDGARVLRKVLTQELVNQMLDEGGE
ncbi:hypothetical protein GPROT1_03053 [Gammaproteobacteria bacterium]|nr:hypothetical protein [Sandaracinaceae bacterium]CAG0991538.1 hypothetical protein GPROT1_03053 [Gammaproteobacteria bacterium]